MAILIVDDSPDQHLLLRAILTKAGHNDIIAVDSAEAAFTTLNLNGNQLSIKIDLILMDALMPVIDGVAACQHIKQQAHLRDIPIIMVTAETDTNNLKNAFSAGAMDYIKKPVDGVELLARVASALRLKNEMDRREAGMKSEIERLKQKQSNNIFISYRREDSADVTGRIYDRLARQFGRDAVFKDVDSMPYGVDFPMFLDSQVEKCDVFLVVIGRNWLKGKGRKGKSRLDEPGDYVRIEIESALKRDIPVVPVCVGGASIPSADSLPASIQNLVHRNGIVLRHDPDFHRDVDRMIEDLEQKIKERIRIAPNRSVYLSHG